MPKTRKHESLPKGMPSRFVLISLSLFALLVAACQSATMEEPQPVVVVEPTPTNTPEPTPTAVPTQEPTPTNPAPGEVEEFPSPDQVWMEEEVFAVARAAGFEPVYELTYYPETVHIPWTMDADGNTVQGITSLDMCGDGRGYGTEAPYLLWFKLHDGYPQWAMDKEVETFGTTVWRGPSYILYMWFGLSFPDSAIGFSGTDVPGNWFELRGSLGHQDPPDVYPSLILPICPELAAEYEGPYKDTGFGMSVILAEP